MSADKLYTEQITLGTTRTNPAAKKVPPGYRVRVKAHNGNTGTVFVGGKDAVTTANGYPLRANEDVLVDVVDVDRVGLIADAASQKISVLVEQ